MQIRITRTSDLDEVLSFLKQRYPLLSEAEIIKMALSNQYYQEAEARHMEGASQQDPTQRFSSAEWRGKFASFEAVRDRISEDDEKHLGEAIDQAVKEVRAVKRL
jgi:phage shock protein A